MQTNSSMYMRVRINVVGVVLSINDRRKRVRGRGLCEPFTKTNFAGLGYIDLVEMPQVHVRLVGGKGSVVVAKNREHTP